MPEKRTPALVDWYRSPLPPALFKQLHARSDGKAWVQTAGCLGLLLAAGALAFWSWGHWAWPVTVALVFAYGMVASFHPNAIHEFGHNTVFRTRIWNRVFLYIYGFLGWHPFVFFDASHQRHHRYTLHPPDDLEVVLPVKLMRRHFWEQGFINYKFFWWLLKAHWRYLNHRYEGDWEQALCAPAEQEQLRRAMTRWSATLFIGHGLIVLVSIWYGLWIVPVLVTLAPFYGGWLFFFCNNAQHTGMRDNVPDFRQCCRTITLNPVVEFLYWHMNYHTEHHMYAAVPCYNLKRLHAAILHDLPPCPHGLRATWRQIGDILRRQEADPTYQYHAPLPTAGHPAG
jgi:fatty acid desaturase